MKFGIGALYKNKLPSTRELLENRFGEKVNYLKARMIFLRCAVSIASAIWVKFGIGILQHGWTIVSCVNIDLVKQILYLKCRFTFMSLFSIFFVKFD
jgi:hypothetical protein